MIEIVGAIEGISYRENVDPQEDARHLVYIGSIRGISMVRKRFPLEELHRDQVDHRTHEE